MNSLVLGLALTASPSTAAHPPAPPVKLHPVVSPYRPGFPPAGVHSYPGRPVFYPPVGHHPGVPHGHRHRPMTLREFAHCFHPTPGTHHVWIIHPYTNCPVEVCFKLPRGHCHPKVDLNRRSIEFDYRDGCEVEICFHRNGKVHVDYDD